MRVLGLLIVVCAGLTAPATANASYSWPLRPFDQRHAIRGGFGDPRIGWVEFLFHTGVDIAAPDGTAVYAVAPGVVSIEAARPRTVTVREFPSVRMISYWHVVPAVWSGMFVREHQLIGRIMAGAGHVHLTENVGGEKVNPLRVGGLTPYADGLAPMIWNLRAEKQLAPLDEAALHGRVDFVVNVSDVPELAPAPPWNDAVHTPALIEWHLLDARRHVVHPLRCVLDTRRTLPPKAKFWDVFARGTVQNAANVEGRYRYWLARNFATSRYPDGDYVVEVFAADVRGNRTRADLRIKIVNEPAPPAEPPQEDTPTDPPS